MWNGKNLAILRVDSELTELELAYIAGITTNDVKSYGKRRKNSYKIRNSEIQKFQEIFHVTEEYFR